MDYTRSLKAAVKKSRISIPEKVFADLMIMGWKEQDAFVAAYGYNVNYSDDYNRTQMRNIIRNPDFAKYMESQGKKIDKDRRESEEGSASNEDVLSKATKEETLKELLIAKQTMRVGSKEWLDATKLIADLQQMKKDIVEDEDTTVHYYLPLNCRNCELYIKATTQNKKKED